MFKFDFQYVPSSHSPSHNEIENYKNKKSVTEPKPHTHTNVHAHTWCCVLNKKTLHKATLLKRWFLIMSIWIKYRFEKNIRTPIFIAALFVIAKIWKQPKCLSVDEWIKQLWDIYRMEFYWTIKGKKMFLFVTVWIDLESIMLSEIRQRKTSTKWFHSCGIQWSNK